MSEEKKAEAAEPAATVPLSAPVKAHGEDVSFLEFREPTSKDLLDLGTPMTFTGNGDVRIDLGVVGKYVVRLAGVTAKSLEQMKPADLMKCAQVVNGFFQ